MDRAPLAFFWWCMSVEFINLSMMQRWICALSVTHYEGSQKICGQADLNGYSQGYIEKCLARLVWDREVSAGHREFAGEVLAQLLGGKTRD